MSFFDELKRRNVFRVAIAYGIAAWFILQLADVVLENIAAPDWVIQTIMLVLVIGFPLAVIFAWAFEMTPEGIRRESDVDRSQSITQHTGRKLDRMIIVVLVLAVGYLLLDKLVLQDRAGDPLESLQTEVTAEASPSVAVLPFVNMSNDAENEYFSDGLTETLLHMLAQLPELRVAARTSSFAFKGRNTSIAEIASALGVAHVLEGSVQKSGGRVRITAQLIRAEDGFHVWSQNYTRPLEDIFAIQDEIATDVAGALDASLLGANDPIQGVETESLDAYDLYLKGLEQQAIFSYGSLQSAEGFFQQALIADADFNEARIALIRNYFLKRLTGMYNNEALISFTRPLVDRVLEQHPDDVQAAMYDHMLRNRFAENTDTREQVRENIYQLRRLLQSVPTETFMRGEIAKGLAFVLEEHEAAIELIQTGLVIDPLSPSLHYDLSSILLSADRLDEAMQAAMKMAEFAPNNPNAYSVMADIERQRNNLPSSLEWLRRAIRVDPQDHEIPYELADLLLDLDLPEEAEPWYARVQALAPGSAMARALEIRRAVARGDEAFALRAARQAVSDQIDTRWGSFDQALLYYCGLMMSEGRSREAYDFLVATRPDIAHWDDLPDDFQGRLMQRFATILMTDFAEPDRRAEAWQAHRTSLLESGFVTFEEGDSLRTVDALMNNNLEDAVRNYLERLEAPIATRPDRHRTVMETFFAPVLSDPRVIAAVSEREREFQAVRNDVRALLSSPEWSEP